MFGTDIRAPYLLKSQESRASKLRGGKVIKTRLKGQSLLEYSILIFCLVAALIAMQIYFKRAIQGQVRRSADDVGEQFDAKKTSGTVTYSVSGKTATHTGLSLVPCESGPKNCIDGYLDLNRDKRIDDQDYVSVTSTCVGGHFDCDDETGECKCVHVDTEKETTVRSGYEEVGPFGGLYE